MISPKAAQLLRILPKSFVSYTAEKLLNKYLNKYANIKVQGMHKLKSIDKPIIFISNHLSNSDGLVLNKILKEQDVTFVAGVKLSDNPITSLGINITKTIPIKPNSADREAVAKIVEVLKSGNNIGIFPEGTRSRSGSMIEGKKGILLIAKLSKAVIVPIGIYGTEKLLPICDEDMASEKFHHADVFVNFGDAITLPQKEKEEGKIEYEERAMNFMMKSIATLLPEQYRGVYR